MANQTIRVGIGFAGKFHYHNLDRVKGVDVRIVGCHSARPRAARSSAAARGIIAFDTFEEMLDHVNVVDNCAPGFHTSRTLSGAPRPRRPSSATSDPPTKRMNGWSEAHVQAEREGESVEVVAIAVVLFVEQRIGAVRVDAHAPI